MVLERDLARNVTSEYRRLLQEQRMPTPVQIATYTNTFRQQFGPERLSLLHGEELLETTHGHLSKRASLFYWLAFKNDQEFPDVFGSIRDRHAMRQPRLVQDKKGEWHYTSGQKAVSRDEAIAIAAGLRDELVRGAEVLERLRHADPESIPDLDQLIERVAPTVAGTAWGHKYFAILYPDRVTTFHALYRHLFHLIKLDQLFSSRIKIYAADGILTEIARQLQMPLHSFAYTLDQLHGAHHRYWAVEIREPNWPELREHSHIAVGWPMFCDLSGYKNRGQAKQHLLSEMGSDWRNWKSVAKGILDFRFAIEEDDVVIATHNDLVLGVGKVTGPYFLDPTAALSHRRPVRWLTTEPFVMPYPYMSRSPVIVLRYRNHSYIWLAQHAERQARMHPATSRISPLHIEQVHIDALGRLEAFEIHFSPSRPDAFQNLNISVLVGENGVGKTTFLRFLSRVFDAPDQATDYAVKYSVRGEQTELARNGWRFQPASVLPAKVIVSTYSPFEQYDTVSHGNGRVPYDYVGAGRRELNLSDAIIPILQAVFGTDRTTLKTADEQRLASYEILLSMVHCTGLPVVQLTDDFEQDTQLVHVQDEMPDADRPNFPDMSEAVLILGQDALKRCKAFWMSTPVAKNMLPSGRIVTREDLSRYPGGIPAFLKDVSTVKNRVNLIKDLWFPRDGTFVPLSQFSSGEVSLLYRFFRLLDVMTNDAVVIIDEPETHLHPRWIMRFVKMLVRVFGTYRAHVLLATHSPLIAADLPNECIIRLYPEADSGHIVARELQDQTLGTNPVQILNDVFGITESVGEFAQTRVDAIRALMDDGKLDDAWRTLDELGNSAIKFQLYLELQTLRGKGHA